MFDLIREFADARPTFGDPQLTELLNQKFTKLGGPRVNRKRAYQILAVNNLLIPRHTGRPIRTHDGQVIALQSNTRWCSEVFAIQCWNGELVWVVFSLDSCDQEVMSYIATTAGISGERVRSMMAETIESRFGIVD